MRERGKAPPDVALAPQDSEHKLPLLNHPLWLVVGSTHRSQFTAGSHRNFVQANILHSGPHNRQATALCGEDVDLIGALPDIAKQGMVQSQGERM